MNQIQIHKEIDDFLKAGTTLATIEIATQLILRNEDAKRYFFAEADETWLKWIWDNGFLNDFKKKTEDPTKYSYRLPELGYLSKMAEKIPSLVVDIIIATPISRNTFNPEVVDRFFWITGLLPSEQVKRVLPKMVVENWVQLMAPFSRSGYEYKKIAERLCQEKDFESLLILSKIILSVRAEDEFSDSERFSISDKLFYLSDVTETGIFEAILAHENNKKEESLKLFSEVLTQIVNLGKDKEETVFDKTEPFYLLDVDIFTLELDTSKRSHLREDIQNFIATYKTLIQQIISSQCDNESGIRKVYTEYVSSLPDSLTCWRLKLYAITRCPDLFKEDIKEALFRVFNVGERYFEIDGGAEYHQGLIASFGSLDSNTTQREYVAKVIEYYGATLLDKDREGWRKRDGLEILTYIKKYLTDEEITKAESVFGSKPGEVKIAPHPSMGKVISGYVSHKSPINPADFTIDELINHLKTDASPKALSEKYKDDDYFNRTGPEGLSDAIKEDFKKRRSEYFDNLQKFFDRDSIDPGYVYAIFRQIEDMLRAKEFFSDTEYTQIFDFLNLVQQSGKSKEFEKSEEKSYLADWITVHKVVADVLLDVLAVIKDSQIFIDNRTRLLSLIKYLLSIKSSPDAEDEKRESGEPAHVALNSVRGQAFRAFVQFTYNEGNKTLSEDVKVLYKHILDTDSSNAVRFTLGQFLASFYFRDIEFIRGLIPKIFPKTEAGKEKQYFATWEGYLASSLYKELFAELQEYYAHAITINPTTYPDRKFSKGLDESLGVHFALAYAHFDFKIGDSLFDLFWKTPNQMRHYEFASFIGRHYLTRDVASDEWFIENEVSKQKLVDLWDWMLQTNVPIEPKAFSGFGFWINPDKEIIKDEIIVEKIAFTLKKSQGELDWEYGLLKRIKKFAEINPEQTLEIIRHLLLLNDGLNPNHRDYFDSSRQIGEPLEIIYKNEQLKKSVESLINELIEKGSSTYWGLKSVIK